eukprot:CAMPEP_0119271644 /NCGR_PEP_ID=MMETSP1329-20130426/8154_1 /TAXON_ID=114041 /ORGANISM="Genus nov. species nov., Strain RCC1024" /LENGTH=681 /DNA_ID=CAMNT_0007271695 /DNA_START=9 /DNA_END=2051 /DNA_ORIENTATION=-
MASIRFAVEVTAADGFGNRDDLPTQDYDVRALRRGDDESLPADVLAALRAHLEPKRTICLAPPEMAEPIEGVTAVLFDVRRGGEGTADELLQAFAAEHGLVVDAASPLFSRQALWRATEARLVAECGYDATQNSERWWSMAADNATIATALTSGDSPHAPAFVETRLFVQSVKPVLEPGKGMEEGAKVWLHVSPGDLDVQLYSKNADEQEKALWNPVARLHAFGIRTGDQGAPLEDVKEDMASAVYSSLHGSVLSGRHTFAATVVECATGTRRVLGYMTVQRPPFSKARDSIGLVRPMPSTFYEVQAMVDSSGAPGERDVPAGSYMHLGAFDEDAAYRRDVAESRDARLAAAEAEGERERQRDIWRAAARARALPFSNFTIILVQRMAPSRKTEWQWGGDPSDAAAGAAAFEAARDLVAQLGADEESNRPQKAFVEDVLGGSLAAEDLPSHMIAILPKGYPCPGNPNDMTELGPLANCGMLFDEGALPMLKEAADRDVFLLDPEAPECSGFVKTWARYVPNPLAGEPAGRRGHHVHPMVVLNSTCQPAAAPMPARKGRRNRGETDAGDAQSDPFAIGLGPSRRAKAKTNVARGLSDVDTNLATLDPLLRELDDFIAARGRGERPPFPLKKCTVDPSNDEMKLINAALRRHDSEFKVPQGSNDDKAKLYRSALAKRRDELRG